MTLPALPVPKINFVATMLSASRNSVVTSSNAGNTENCSGLVMLTAISAITMDAAKLNTMKVSSIHFGMGRISIVTTTKIASAIIRSELRNARVSQVAHAMSGSIVGACRRVLQANLRRRGIPPDNALPCYNPPQCKGALTTGRLVRFGWA
jgi:hypothetical protein